jgi:NADPH-dependent curcumin reductase CurA
MSQSRYAVVFTRRPDGAPIAGDFAILENPLPVPVSGEVLVAAHCISIDPYVRTMIDPNNPYGAPLELGIAIPGDVAGQVIASNSADFAVGDWVAGRLGWQSHAVTAGEGLRRLDLDLADIPTHLALLGSSGLTAWFGMMEIGRPRSGENVLVSGAAGAVGQVASQLAKTAGAHVFGIAGGAGKCAHLTDELGLAGAIDHRADRVDKDLDRLCPDGFDVYFDNVGGKITDAVMARLKRHARVVVCGESSQYDAIGHEFNPRILGPLMDTRATMTGLLVTDFAERYEAARGELARLNRAGDVKVHVDFVDGLENAPQAFIGMLKGENTGKRLVRVTRPTRMS